MSNITLKELLDIGILIDDTTPLLKKRDKKRYKIFFTDVKYKTEKIIIYPNNPKYRVLRCHPGTSRDYHPNSGELNNSLEEAEKVLVDDLIKFIVNRLFEVRVNYSNQVAELLSRETILNIKSLYGIYKTRLYLLSYFLYNTELKDKEFRAKDIIKNYIKKEFKLHGESICL